jgi:hypothetical protein
MSFWFYILVSDVPEMAREEIDFDMGKFILEKVDMVDYFSEGEMGVEILFWGGLGEPLESWWACWPWSGANG